MCIQSSPQEFTGERTALELSLGNSGPCGTQRRTGSVGRPRVSALARPQWPYSREGARNALQSRGLQFCPLMTVSARGLLAGASGPMHTEVRIRVCGVRPSPPQWGLVCPSAGAPEDCRTQSPAAPQGRHHDLGQSEDSSSFGHLFLQTRL